MQAMVEAVPITAQVPAVVASLPSTSEISASSILPARYCAQKRRQSVQAPSRYRAHQLRRNRLVATAHEHHRVHGLRAHHFLGVHRHEVAEFHAGRIEKDLAERNRGKCNRQRAGRQNTALYGVEQFGEVPMAIVEARGRIRNTDDRLLQHGQRIAHRLREGPAQIEGKIAITVVGEAVRDAGGFFVHADTLCNRSSPDASRRTQR